MSTFTKDGTLWARGELTGMVMTGYWEWFRKDGSLMRTGSFVKGEQVGEWTTYDKTGRVVKVTVLLRAPAVSPSGPEVKWWCGAGETGAS